MKPEINFYQIDENIIKSLAPLLLKVLEENKKALIFCAQQSQIKSLDDSLWSYGRNKFIPHSTAFDKEFAPLRQPVFLTNKEENSNKADYLVFLDEPSESFLNSFKRVFYFFEEKEFSTAKKLAAKLQPKNSYKKEAGKWVKFSF